MIAGGWAAGFGAGWWTMTLAGTVGAEPREPPTAGMRTLPIAGCWGAIAPGAVLIGCRIGTAGWRCGGCVLRLAAGGWAAVIGVLGVRLPCSAGARVGVAVTVAVGGTGVSVAVLVGGTGVSVSVAVGATGG